MKISAQNKLTSDSYKPDSITSLNNVIIHKENHSSFYTKSIIEHFCYEGQSLSEYLQGKISSVEIISPSNEPGRSSQIVIQGLNLSGNRQPLVLIDGIPQLKRENLFNYYNDNSEDVFNIIPVALQDVKSVRIIKSPVSTVLYGTDGIDGVILLETKDGGEETFHVNYQYHVGTHFKPEYPSMLNGEEYTKLQLDEWHNAYGVFDIPPEIAYDRDYEDFYNYSANTNWLEAVSQSGFSSIHYVNVYGKKNKIRYYTSVDYLKESGTLINTGYNRFLNRSKIDIDFTKKLTASLNFFYSNNKYDGNYVLKDENMHDQNILEMAFIKSPNMSIWEYDKEGELTGEYFSPITNYQGDGRYYYNPVAVSQLGETKKNLNELESTLSFKYIIKNWAQLEELVTYNIITVNSKETLPYTAVSPELMVDKEINEYGFNFITNRYRSETRLFVKAPFQNEDKNILQGSIVWSSKYLDNSLSPISNTTNWNINNQKLTKNAMLTTISYKHNNRYFVDFNTNFESFSRINNERNWNSNYGCFVGWEFTNETFMEKLRNFGQGNLHAGFGFSDYNYNMVFPYGSSFLSPEQTLHSYNIGLDLNIFNDKLEIETDYVKRNIDSDENIVSNLKGIGISSRGMEASVSYTIVSKKARFCEIYLNIASNNFILNYIPENINTIGGGLSNGQYITYLKKGDTPGSIYGLKYLGVYSTNEDAVATDKQGNILYDSDGNPLPMSYYGNYNLEGGDVKYYDSNSDGIIDENDITYLGDSYPKITGGFGTHVKVNRISVAINFNYWLGHEIINQIAMDSESLNTKNNQNINSINRWSTQGQIYEGMLHRAYLLHPANNLGSDLYVESGNFLRINNISLGYTLNPSICKKLHLNSLQFTLSGQHLFTFTNYTGLDPEIESQYTIDWLRKDKIRAYPTKVIRFGFQLGI